MYVKYIKKNNLSLIVNLVLVRKAICEKWLVGKLFVCKLLSLLGLNQNDLNE